MGCKKLSYYEGEALGKLRFFYGGALEKKGIAEKKGCNVSRFGFNGMEKDNEIKGIGNSLNYKFRMQDTRLGRFFAVDPLAAKFPMLTTYQVASNRPIDHVELEGLEGADFRFRQYMKSKGGVRAMAEYKADEMRNQGIEQGGKLALRYLTPVEDIYGVMTGEDFDGNSYNRAEAGGWAAASFIPGAKILKAVKPVLKVVKAGRKLSSAGKAISNAIKTNKSIKNSFKGGKSKIMEATEDITVYRVSGGTSKKGTGDFFSLTKPSSSAEAEKMLNINKWGNTGVEVTPVTIKKGTQFATGGVAGGTGAQVFIPKRLQKEGGNNVIRHYSKTEKLK